MEAIKTLLTASRLSGWVIEEVQKSLGITSSMRLRVDTDNPNFWQRSGDGIFVHLHGMNQNSPIPIEVTYFWETETASIWVDDLSSLIRPDRYHTFERDDFFDVEPGEIERDVALAEAIERIEIWKTLPPNPKPDTFNRPPNVVGMMHQ